MTKEQILYEDNDIIVCYKPAGIATQTAKIGQRDMVSEVTNYLAGKYVGCVHRLDQPVEGILVFALNQNAAAGLSRQIVENRMKKYYYAVVADIRPDVEAVPNPALEPEARPDSVRWKMLTDYLCKDNRTNLSRIVSSDTKGARKAVLEYQILEKKTLSPKTFQTESFGEKKPPSVALVRVRLITGRHHQIRVQMSHAGMGLLGDFKYAGERTKELSGALGIKQAALCAYRLEFEHPATGEKLSFQRKPEGVVFQNFSI